MLAKHVKVIDGPILLSPFRKLSPGKSFWHLVNISNYWQRRRPRRQRQRWFCDKPPDEVDCDQAEGRGSHNRRSQSHDGNEKAVCLDD